MSKDIQSIVMDFFSFILRGRALRTKLRKRLYGGKSLNWNPLKKTKHLKSKACDIKSRGVFNKISTGDYTCVDWLGGGGWAIFQFLCLKEKGVYYIAIYLLPFIETDTESSSHPIERDGKFLWIKKKTDNVSNELARVHSTEYQNSASSCNIRLIYI